MDSNIRKRVIDEFMREVRIASPSLHELEFFDYLKKRLEALSLEIQFQSFEMETLGLKSGNLIVKLPANEKGHRTLFFDSHVDTVEPATGIEPVLKDGVIRSAGETVLGSDDKAGVAAMIIALEELVQSDMKHGDVYFLFTSAEEIGLVGVNHLDMKEIKADFGFVLDSHGDVGGIVLAAPYHYTYEIIVRGKSSHAGIEPEKGVNAILLMAELLPKLPHGRIDAETSANIGLIEGGKATNIVPDECRIRGEFRSRQKSKTEALKREIFDLVRSFEAQTLGIDIQMKEEYRGFEIPSDAPIVRLVDQAIALIGKKARHEKTGGGSNTNVYNANGLPALTLAIGMTDVHSTAESIQTENLVDLVRLILKLVELA